MSSTLMARKAASWELSSQVRADLQVEAGGQERRDFSQAECDLV